jgi:hypothetical protein
MICIGLAVNPETVLGQLILVFGETFNHLVRAHPEMANLPDICVAQKI